MDSGSGSGKAEKGIWGTEFHVSHINRSCLCRKSKEVRKNE